MEKSNQTKKNWWEKHAPWSFLSTAEEWHAWAIGWAETACPWRPRHGLKEQAEYKPWKEYHYYLVGRFAGMVTLLLVLIGLAKLVEVVIF